MTAPRTLVALLSAAAALGLAACGQEAQERGSFQSENAQVAETEGIYLTLDEMKYQVQASRQLNPLLIDDKAYLEGVSADDRELGSDEVWFAVFLRVENETEETLEVAEDFEIRDTQESIYRPVSIEAGNDFAYRPGPIEGKELYPLPNSPAGERPPQGAVLLFKIKRISLDNRPLELLITSPEGEEGFVNLDV